MSALLWVLPEVPCENLPSVLKALRNFLTVNPPEKQPPQAMRLPWQEDRSRRNPQGHVGSILLCALR